MTKTLRAEATALGGLATALEPRNETWGPGGAFDWQGFWFGVSGEGLRGQQSLRVWVGKVTVLACDFRTRHIVPAA